MLAMMPQRGHSAAFADGLLLAGIFQTWKTWTAVSCTGTTGAIVQHDRPEGPPAFCIVTVLAFVPQLKPMLANMTRCLKDLARTDVGGFLAERLLHMSMHESWSSIKELSHAGAIRRTSRRGWRWCDPGNFRLQCHLVAVGAAAARGIQDV